MFTKFICIMCLIDAIRSEMEPFIVGGEYARIDDFPHSAFLGITCVLLTGGVVHYKCGGSILNQQVILTAAHCLAGCIPGSHVSVTVGHEDNHKGQMASLYSYMVHENYKPESTRNDIALGRLKTSLTFNNKISRVAIMRDPPYNEVAKLAGWGLTDESKKTVSNLLKYIEQSVWSKERCSKFIKPISKGTLCASAANPNDYAARGDSGSALMVRDYIQIGLVSYKVPSVARNLIIYTDIGYFYDWIENRTKIIMCEHD